MRLLFDQMDRFVQVPEHPKRIVSLVPSQTELLFYLGLEQEIVGITTFCIHPKNKHATTTKVGGTKNFKIERIRALKPDLIIGNKEENSQKLIEELEGEFPVWMSDISTFEDALSMIEQVGELVSKQEAAKGLIDDLNARFQPFIAKEMVFHRREAPKVLYLIWNKPYMVAAKGTFIHEMLQLAGFSNAADEHDRYPAITPEAIADIAPELIFLSSEPFPFKDKHIAELQAIVPNSHIKLVDGELFSWYGSRLLHSADYFKELWKGLILKI